MPIRGVLIPELRTEVPTGERPTDRTGLGIPDSIGGFGGVEIGSGTIRDGETRIGIPQCTSDSELFRLSCDKCVKVEFNWSAVFCSTKPDSFRCSTAANRLVSCLGRRCVGGGSRPRLDSGEAMSAISFANVAACDSKLRLKSAFTYALRLHFRIFRIGPDSLRRVKI